MAKKGKKYRNAASKIESRPYQLNEAIELLKSLEEDEIVVKVHKHAATIDALVEYELDENTRCMVEVEDYGTLPVYKLVFPLDDHAPSCRMSKRHVAGTS